MLQLDHVTRHYGGVHALDDLTLTVPAGARHAVIGANGAGKTTLLHLVAGLLRPTRGRILLDGHDITRLPPHARARRGIARTFQHPAVLHRLPAAATVELALTRHTPPPVRYWPPRRADTARRARAVLDTVGLAAHASTPAGHLPYGHRRLVELAAALATRPRLLLLDEPSAGLEPDELTRLAATLTALPARTTLILVDHHLDLVHALADTVTVLHHGRHLATGTPQAISTHPEAQAAYPTTTTPRAPVASPAKTQARPILLRVRDLQVAYHGAPVLHHVNLDLPAGTVLAVLGRNGAGKTTLLNTLAGLHTPALATVAELAGTPLPLGHPTRTSHLGVALVPQGRRLFTHLTVAEHLTAATPPRPPAHPGRRWTRDDVLDLLPALRSRLRHHPGQLSGGEQQMLALARALLTAPRLLLLDEPTEGLAPTLAAHLAATIRTISHQQVTVLLADHDPHPATDLADAVVELDHGTITTPAATLGQQPPPRPAGHHTPATPASQ